MLPPPLPPKPVTPAAEHGVTQWTGAAGHCQSVPLPVLCSNHLQWLFFTATVLKGGGLLLEFFRDPPKPTI